MRSDLDSINLLRHVFAFLRANSIPHREQRIPIQVHKRKERTAGQYVLLIMEVDQIQSFFTMPFLEIIVIQPAYGEEGMQRPD